MSDTKAVVEDALYLTFDAETFTLSQYLVRSVTPDKVRQGTFLYKKPKLTMDFADGTDRRGNIYFKVSPRCSTFTIPEITFSGEYTEGSQVMTLDVSAENNSTLGQKALDFVRN